MVEVVEVVCLEGGGGRQRQHLGATKAEKQSAPGGTQRRGQTTTRHNKSRRQQAVSSTDAHAPRKGVFARVPNAVGLGGSFGLANQLICAAVDDTSASHDSVRHTTVCATWQRRAARQRGTHQPTPDRGKRQVQSHDQSAPHPGTYRAHTRNLPAARCLASPSTWHSVHAGRGTKESAPHTRTCPCPRARGTPSQSQREQAHRATCSHSRLAGNDRPQAHSRSATAMATAAAKRGRRPHTCNNGGVLTTTRAPSHACLRTKRGGRQDERFTPAPERGDGVGAGVRGGGG